MNITQIKKFCRYLRVQVFSERTKGWAKIQCPLAPYLHESGRDSNPSFGIEIKNSRPSTAHCFTCGFTGDLGELITELKYRAGKDSDMDLVEARKMAEEDEEGGGMEIAYADEDEKEGERESIHYFPEDWLETFPHAEDSEDTLAYCESRGVPRWVIKELGLRYDVGEHRICFPIRDDFGDLIGLHGRGLTSDITPKYRMYTYPARKGNNNPQFWYGEDTVDWDKPVVVVESVFDYLSVYRCYKNVICPLTAQISTRKIKRIQDALFLVLIFDSDKPGRKASYKIKKVLKHLPVVDIRLPEGYDPGDLSVGEITDLLEPHLNNMLTNEDFCMKIKG